MLYSKYTNQNHEEEKLYRLLLKANHLTKPGTMLLVSSKTSKLVHILLQNVMGKEIMLLPLMLLFREA